MEELAGAADYLAAAIAVTGGVVVAWRAQHAPPTAIRRYLAAAPINLGVATGGATSDTVRASWLTRPSSTLFANAIIAEFRPNELVRDQPRSGRT